MRWHVPLRPSPVDEYGEGFLYEEVGVDSKLVDARERMQAALSFLRAIDTAAFDEHPALQEWFLVHKIDARALHDQIRLAVLREQEKETV